MPAALHNFLDEPLLTAASPRGTKARYTLPGSFAALVRGEIAAFSGLRSHQRHVWHAFIVQLAALALEKAKQSRLPEDETAWRRMLRGLTLNWPDGEPWSLVVPDASKPALLQSPVPGGELPQCRTVETPDGLDMLVTSKNHDLKAARMYHAAPEDWLFALVSLQTQQGIMGAGKYGITRMNGGYGSRPVVGLDNPGDAGSRFRRDVTALISTAEDKANPHGLGRDGTALVWLKPWNGSTPMDFRDLHPLYIEICPARQARFFRRKNIRDGRAEQCRAHIRGRPAERRYRRRLDARQRGSEGVHHRRRRIFIPQTGRGAQPRQVQAPHLRANFRRGRHPRSFSCPAICLPGPGQDARIS